MSKKDSFSPNWASLPGRSLSDFMEEKELSSEEIADNLSIKIDDLSDILNGHAFITEELADKLEKITGAPTKFWLAREKNYRDKLLQIDRPDDTDWTDDLPVADMIKFGWIKKHDNNEDIVAACLDFFDVKNVADLRGRYSNLVNAALFKSSRSFTSEKAATAAWIRRGEIESNAIHCEPWNAARFRQAMVEIRKLTRRKSPELFLSELRQLCAGCGVALSVVPAPSKCHASGAARFVSKNKASIVLSFRHMSDDHFWFSFFHESGHLLLHSNSAIFVEEEGMISSVEEQEANKFAAEIIIPKQFQSEFERLYATTFNIIRFAVHVGVTPGLIVGQLQHSGRIKYNQFNKLKRRFGWKQYTAIREKA